MSQVQSVIRRGLFMKDSKVLARFIITARVEILAESEEAAWDKFGELMPGIDYGYEIEEV